MSDGVVTAARGGVRERVLAGALAEVARQGMGATTLEDVARAAGVSRATVYRHFPGGRDELFGALVDEQVQRFFEGLDAAAADATDLGGRLVEALLAAHRAVAGHAVLRSVLAEEPDRLVPLLADAGRRVLPELAARFEPLVAAGGGPPGIDPHEAASYLARLVLSFIVAPGSWNLSDRGDVEELVRTQLGGGRWRPTA